MKHPLLSLGVPSYQQDNWSPGKVKRKITLYVQAIIQHNSLIQCIVRQHPRYWRPCIKDHVETGNYNTGGLLENWADRTLWEMVYITFSQTDDGSIMMQYWSNSLAKMPHSQWCMLIKGRKGWSCFISGYSVTVQGLTHRGH